MYNIRKNLFGLPYENATMAPDRHLDKAVKGWRRCDLDCKMKESSPLYLTLYLKLQAGTPVNATIAIRGTYNLSNLKQDLTTWFSEVAGDAQHDHYPKVYMHSVLGYFRKVKTYLQRIAPALTNRVTFTGHSLGGALAKLMVAQYDGYKAVVFNPPGVAKLIEHPHHSNAIYSVNAKYGLINKAGSLLPGIHLAWIDVNEHEQQAKQMIAQFNQYGKSECQHGANQYRQGGIHTPAGLFLKVKALLQSDKALQQDLHYERQHAECQLLRILPLGTLETHACDATTTINEYKTVIMSQHSIDNIVKTLTEPRYHTLACQIV